MSEANAHRGEIEIDFGAGGKQVLRPDFEAVAAIDAAVGGIVALAEKAFRTNGTALTMDEMAIIVAKGMDGAARKDGKTAGMSVEKVKRLIYDAGLPSAIGPCIAFLGNAITGGAVAEPGADAGNG